MYTIALSGPKRSRAKAELLLEEARIPTYPTRHHAVRDWARIFPEDKEVFLAVEHDDVDHVAKVVGPAKFRLRMHYPTPPEPQPDPMADLVATVEEMRARIAELEAGRS